MFEFLQFIAMEIILNATEDLCWIKAGLRTQEESMERTLDTLSHAAMYHSSVVPMGEGDRTRAITTVAVGVDAMCHYLRTDI